MRSEKGNRHRERKRNNPSQSIRPTSNGGGNQDHLAEAAQKIEKKEESKTTRESKGRVGRVGKGQGRPRGGIHEKKPRKTQKKKKGLQRD